jgi:hypothetical protein
MRRDGGATEAAQPLGGVRRRSGVHDAGVAGDASRRRRRQGPHEAACRRGTGHDEGDLFVIVVTSVAWTRCSAVPTTPALPRGGERRRGGTEHDADGEDEALAADAVGRRTRCCVARRRQRFHEEALCAVSTITTQALTTMKSLTDEGSAFHEAAGRRDGEGDDAGDHDVGVEHDDAVLRRRQRSHEAAKAAGR